LKSLDFESFTNTRPPFPILV